jgi:hypothetical protein
LLVLTCSSVWADGRAHCRARLEILLLLTYALSTPQGRRYVHADNIVGTLTSVPMESKKVVVKSILFGVPHGNSFTLVEGEYRFDIYVEASNAPRVVHNFKCAFSDQALSDYVSGKTIAQSHFRIHV